MAFLKICCGRVKLSGFCGMGKSNSCFLVWRSWYFFALCTGLYVYVYVCACVDWAEQVRLLDTVPQFDVIPHLPVYLDGIFGILGDQNKEIRKM